jgi:hypothetical protein
VYLDNYNLLLYYFDYLEYQSDLLADLLAAVKDKNIDEIDSLLVDLGSLYEESSRLQAERNLYSVLLNKDEIKNIESVLEEARDSINQRIEESIVPEFLF